MFRIPVFVGVVGVWVCSCGTAAFAQQTADSCEYNTGHNATYVFPAGIPVAFSGSPLASGDRVRAYTSDGLCVGTLTWSAAASQAMTVWGDDPFSSAVDGMREGEEIVFRAYDTSAGLTYAQVTVTYARGSSTYTTDGINVAASLQGGSSQQPNENRTYQPSAGKLPLYLGAPVGYKRSASFQVDVSGVQRAVLGITAYDLHALQEGRLYVNGTEVPLPADLLGTKASVSHAFDIDPGLLAQGTNTVTFGTAALVPGGVSSYAYRIDDLELTAYFSSTGGGGPSPCTGTPEVRTPYTPTSGRLPLYLGDPVGYKRSVSFQVDPAGATGAALSVTAYDIDVLSEARLYVNGTPVPLPQGLLGPNSSVQHTFNIDVGLLKKGENKVVFETAQLLPDGQSYAYRVDDLELVLVHGGSCTGTAASLAQQSTSDALPEAFALQGNYPNPFRSATTITFDLPEAARVRLEVYDALGRRVLVLPEVLLQAGAQHRLEFDGSALASGIYFYRVSARTAGDTFVESGRMMLLK